MTRNDHIASLDAFRGLAVAGMIVVNNPGNWNNVFSYLTHADWNGCTLADVVFPFFLFIVGAAMPFAFRRRIERNRHRYTLYIRIAGRALSLIVLGLALNVVAAWPDLHQMRVPGVLQRIALVYLVAAPIVLHAGPALRTVILGSFALVHWIVLVRVPIAGVPAGLMPTHNIAAFIDTTVFGSHILAPTGDPEGLLGTLPAVSTALVGSIAGDCLREEVSARVRLARLAGVGAVALAVGAAWSMALPLNKSLWTGSFAMWTAGLAALVLAGCYLVVDVKGRRGWAQPFIWLGFNPLVIYILSEVVSYLFDKPMMNVHGQVLTVRSWLFWDVFRPMTPPGVGDEWLSLMLALAVVSVWIGVAGILYRQRIRIHV